MKTITEKQVKNYVQALNKVLASTNANFDYSYKEKKEDIFECMIYGERAKKEDYVMIMFAAEGIALLQGIHNLLNFSSLEPLIIECFIIPEE